MLNYLTGAYASGDKKVRLLYKYRPCESHHIRCLNDDTLWFSTADQLNDPFDCLVRLPEVLDQTDLDEIRARLAEAQPFCLTLDSSQAVAEYIGAVSEMPPLVPLGLMATQLAHERLLSHIREINAESDQWIGELFVMAREVAEAVLHNTTVFCLCEPRDHQLMWAHYAASHTGFCTGYVSPIGIDSPRLIHKVTYTKSPPKISPWRLIDDPGQVYSDLTLTKPSEWSYESEWRVTLGNMPGLNHGLLPYKEVILGARISPEHERQIREAIDGRDVALYRADTERGADSFEIGIEPA